MIRKKPRRDPRFPVRNFESVTAKLVRGDSQVTLATTVHLEDLSRGGAKLASDEPVQFGEALTLNLSAESMGLDLSIAAEVCWARRQDDQWRVGCSFKPELPANSLEKLFSIGLLERRLFSREPRRIPIMAQWELDSDAAEACLWDVSEGGFCILSSQPRKAGRRVLVSADSPQGRVEVPAKTQWELKVGAGYVVGCEFFSKDGFLLLRTLQGAFANAASPSGPERRGSVRSRFHRLVGGIFSRSAAPAQTR